MGFSSFIPYHPDYSLSILNSIYKLHCCLEPIGLYVLCCRLFLLVRCSRENLKRNRRDIKIVIDYAYAVAEGS
jgi:hypothetical protein